jgi:hypothetical protein
MKKNKPLSIELPDKIDFYIEEAEKFCKPFLFNGLSLPLIKGEQLILAVADEQKKIINVMNKTGNRVMGSVHTDLFDEIYPLLLNRELTHKCIVDQDESVISVADPESSYISICVSLSFETINTIVLNHNY